MNRVGIFIDLRDIAFAYKLEFLDFNNAIKLTGDMAQGTSVFSNCSSFCSSNCSNLCSYFFKCVSNVLINNFSSCSEI